QTLGTLRLGRCLVKPHGRISRGKDRSCSTRDRQEEQSSGDIYATYAWLENPVKFEKSHGVHNALDTEIIPKSDNKEAETHILIVDGFMLYTYKPLINVLNQPLSFILLTSHHNKRINLN
uniref:Muscle-specific beta 1 integrin binding protein 2 n=1 Tax=Labrus bergylta TaxID=56723 RepID=A0A3Q3ENS4_9LABR